MSTANVKSELMSIAEHLPESASYTDVMYELYVRMKITGGQQAADEGHVITHDEVKHRFSK